MNTGVGDSKLRKGIRLVRLDDGLGGRARDDKSSRRLSVDTEVNKMREGR